MLTLTADYHTHTRFSHGKGDIEDNVLAARALGLKTVGITDHGYGHMGYGIRRRDLPLAATGRRAIFCREKRQDDRRRAGTAAALGRSCDPGRNRGTGRAFNISEPSSHATGQV